MIWSSMLVAAIAVSDATAVPSPCEAIVARSSRAFDAPEVSPPADLDAYITCVMRERQIPGVAVGISYEGKVLTERAYGLASVQNDSPVTTRTRFEIASITKPITAVGILLLAEDGRLQLDAPVSRYLSDAPPQWSRMTIRHLLSHTSGMPPMGYGWSERTTQKGDDLILALSRDRSTQMEYKLARQDRQWFEPGSNWAYSDVGYFLLGVITEKVSGMPWREFIRQRIFVPLAMNASYVLDQWGVYKDEARAYTIRNGQLANARRDLQMDTPSHQGIFSTVGDLARFDAALHAGKLLTPASRAEMWSPTTLASGESFPYGLGWEVWSSRGHATQYHAGYTGTEFLRLPEKGITITVLTNLGAATRLGLAHNIAKMMVPALRRPSLRATPISRETLGRYAGLYRSVDGYRIEVRLENGSLTAPYPWPFPRMGGRGVLVHQGNHVFEFADHDGRITFTVDRNGTAVSAVAVAWDGGLRSDFIRESAGEAR